MDLQLVSERLAALGQSIDGVLRSDPFVPDAVTEPHFYVGEFVIAYGQTFGGQMQVDISLILLVARSTDRVGQKRLKAFMKRTGPSSVKAVIEGESGVPQSLGGACDDLYVGGMRGHRLYQVGEDRYYGAEWTVRVIGTDSEGE